MMSANQEEQYCGACGKPQPSDARFCQYCGQPIAQTLRGTGPTSADANARPRRRQRPLTPYVLGIGILVVVVIGSFVQQAQHGSAPHGPATVSSSDPAVQNVLTFQPSCATDDVATSVEQLEQETSYIGSSDYPGTFTTAPAAHGATIVTWTLPSHTVYKFQISQDGQYLTYLNDNAQMVNC